MVCPRAEGNLASQLCLNLEPGVLAQIPCSDSHGIIFPTSAPPMVEQGILRNSCGCAPAALLSEHRIAGEGAEKGIGQSGEPASTVCAVGILQVQGALCSF